MKKDKEFFNLEDFKKWMESQSSKRHSMHNDDSLIGKKVTSRINSEKLTEKMEIEDGEIEDLVEEFKKKGGMVADTDGQKLLIEVESGSFILSKNYVKISF